MSIDDAVDLVLFAYEHGAPGDIFVQKAPAATIETLALAVKKVFDAPNPIQIIGTRHGEKLFETLLTREERVKAQDMGSYFRVPADNRDLNYNVYFAQGEETLSHEEDYHSHNTERLDVDVMAAMLLKLELVQRELGDWRGKAVTRA
jgi:UDP-glucose 4-epimerase